MSDALRPTPPAPIQPPAPPRIPGLTLTVRRAPDGTFTLPMDDPITLEVYGFTPAELQADARVLFERTHPEDLATLMAAIEVSGRDLSPLHLRLRYEHPLKGWRWLEAWTHPLREANGGTLWRGFAMDITTQAEQELALQERLQASEAKFNRAFTSAPLALVISRASDGTILELNAEYCALTGFSREEALGRTSAELGMISPEGRGALVQEVLKGHGLRDFPATLRAKNGRLHHCRLFLEPAVIAEEPVYITMLQDRTALMEAETTRKDLETRLQLLIDHAPAALALFDREMRYLAVSQRWVEDFKLTREALLGRSHYEVFPNLPETWKAIHRRVFAGETLRADEDPFPRPDGSVQWLRWEVRPWHQGDGTVGGLVIFSEDITERKAAEAARGALQAKLAVALESMTDAVWITDAEGSFVDLNEAFARIHRFESKETCLRTYSAYPDLIELTDTDGTEVPVDQWAVPRALRGESASNATYGLRRKDTGESWVGSYSFAPIRNEVGAIVGSVVVGRDITEQARLQRDLQESEARFRAIVEGSQAVMLVLDPATGRIVLANPAAEAFYGWDQATLQGMRIQEINTQPPEEVRRLIGKVTSGSLTHFITWHRRADGNIREVEAFASPIRVGGEGRNFIIIQDLTERRAAEAEVLRQATEMDLFFEANLDLLCIASTDGRFLRVNPQWEQVLGYSPAELEGVRYLDLVHPEDQAATAEAAGRLNNQEALTGFVNRYRCKDGSYRWIEWKTAVRGDKVYAAARDISERLEAEASLRASEERFRQISEAAWEWIWEVDAEGLYTYASPAVAQHLGYEPEELVGRVRFHDLWPAELRETLLAQVTPLFQARETFRNLPNPCVHKDGHRVLIESTGFPILGPDGRLRGYRGTDRDVTEREEARVALQQSQERFERAFMGNPIPMAISRAADQIILAVNDSWVELTGIPREAVLGKTLPKAGLLMDPTGREEALQRLKSAGRLRNYPISLVRPDGKVRELLLNGERMQLAGEWCNVSSAQDVTEQRRAERALRESEGRFRGLFEHSPVAIWEEDFSLVAKRFRELRAAGITDLALHLAEQPGALEELASCIRVLRVNAASLKLLGLPSDPEPKGDLPRFLTPEARVVLQHELVVLFRGGTHFEAETTHLNAQGQVIDVKLHVTVVPGHQEDLGRVLVSFTDLTARKAAESDQRRMEHELQHLQRLESLGRLAGGVSHDMNNVLGAIMAVGSLLKVRHGDSPDLVRDAEALLHAAVRGRDLVRGLRDFSRKELEGAVELDLNELARREAELLERTLLKRVAIRLELASNLPPIFGEGTSIQNALMNLCLNALDAMPESGTITLRTTFLDPGLVALIVEDDGEGMPPEVAARALEPFFTTKPAGKGTGLGLSQVYGMVKAHGGSMDLQSTLGKGTRITLAFPQASSIPRSGDPEELEEHLPSRPLEILLVDDEGLIRGTVANLLEVLGHRPQVATSGLEALRRLSAGLRVDLIMLDLNMPGMDGVETLQRIRILRPDQPVLIATGFADERIPGVLQRFPEVRILKKPFGISDLQRALAIWP